MSAYLWLPLVQTLFCLSLIAIVLRANSRSFTHRLFSLFLLGLAVWGAVIFAMRASPDLEHAYFWDRCLIPLVPFWGVLFYHFALNYTITKTEKWVIPLLYVVCFLFIPLAPTDLVFSGMQVKPYGYAPIFGPLWPVWTLFGYVMPIIGLLVFIKTYRTSPYAEQRNRAAYIILGITFVLVGGAFDILPILGLPLYPGMIFGNIVFCLLTTVAIVKHQLLDIRIVLRRGIAYMLTSAMIALPLIGILILVTHFLTEEGFRTWAYIILLILLAFTLPQFWRTTQQRVDRWFYRERYDYLKTLETFSWQTQSLTDSAELGSTVVSLIAGALRTTNVHLLQPVPPRDDFSTVSSTGLNNTTSKVVLKSRGPLVKWLKRHDSILCYYDLDFIPQLQGVGSEERKKLRDIGADLIVPIKLRSGQLSGVLVVGKKISEQPYTVEDKQLINALSSQIAMAVENARLYTDTIRARENLEVWLNSMSDCVMIVSADYTMQFMNRAAITRFGNQIGGICWAALGKDRACHNCPIPLGLDNNMEGSQYVETIGGREYEVANAPLLNPDGSASVIDVLRDITERRRAEEREKELQEELNLSSRLASIGRLAAGVAHEINNPLTGILGFSQRLLRKSTDEKISQDLEIIHNEARRAARVIENLLTFARRREPKKEYFDINEVLQKALELRAYELKTGNIEVVTDLAPGLPQTMVDFHQIQQVFLNIILNAEQAITEANCGGKLSIKTQQVKDYIRISFTDDGPGIPAERLGKVFDPFFTARGEGGGTGLGLSVCHGIVVEHGGRIYASSKPGKGASFIVELPIEELPM